MQAQRTKDFKPSICPVHGEEPDPLVDPGAAIGWHELHYGDFTFDDDWGKVRIVGPMSKVCRRRVEA